MELLILDALLRPVIVVDLFESAIWAERRAKKGDFHLVVQSTPANRDLFLAETLLTHNNSRRVMAIETVVEEVNEDGVTVLDVKGKEITRLLDGRPALKAVTGGVAKTWLIPAMTPANAARHIFDQICVAGTLGAGDIIPFITPGNQYPADTIPEPADLIDWEQQPNSVTAAIEEIAEIYDLGYRLYRDMNVFATLYFNVYAGSDRTTAQSTLPPVVFAHDLENLQSTTELNDISGAYNVVRVLYTFTTPSEVEGEPDVEETLTFEVYDSENSPEGFSRRVKILVISSVPEEIEDVPAFLVQAAWDELMKNRPISAFDGQVVQTSQYVYERDFYLGDLVEIRSSTGGTAYMRVEEYIFVQDSQGERSYPTLVTNAYKEPGTWESYKYDVDWDLFPDEDWDEQ